MLRLYKQTQLEDIIQSLYVERGILSPADLGIENVAERFNIRLEYMNNAPDRSLWNDKKAIIFLNPNRPNDMLREVFFHELCHPLGHYGMQSKMNNDLFRELQEIQAGQFQLYAALPFFMIQELDLSINKQEMVMQLTETFNVTLNMANKRVDQIERRIYQAKSDEAMRTFSDSMYPKAPPYSNETNDVLKRLTMLLNKKGVKA